MASLVFWFPRPATMNYHKVGGLNNRSILLTLPEVRRLKSRYHGVSRALLPPEGSGKILPSSWILVAPNNSWSHLPRSSLTPASASICTRDLFALCPLLLGGQGRVSEPSLLQYDHTVTIPSGKTLFQTR